MSIEERVIIQDDVVESPHNPFFHRHRCCFHFPCFSSSPSTTTTRHVTLGGPPTTSSSFWDRFRPTDSDNRWWTRPFKKIREWSEILAGPQWKTFIRRFNRKRHKHLHHHHHHNHNSAQFQYDPLSYALNFDEGPGQNGHFDEDYDNGHFPDFSSRYASVPLTSPIKSHTTGLGNGTPPKTPPTPPC